VARKRDLLRRFRLIAVPGAAGLAGVPSDREALLRDELAPIFGALSAVEDEATNVVARATADGSARRAHAAEEARRILDGAEDRAPSERVAAAEAATTSAESEAAELRASGHEEAQRTARLAAERMPAMVNELTERVLSTGSSLEEA